MCSVLSAYRNVQYKSNGTLREARLKNILSPLAVKEKTSCEAFRADLFLEDLGIKKEKQLTYVFSIEDMTEKNTKCIDPAKRDDSLVSKITKQIWVLAYAKHFWQVCRTCEKINQ